MGVCVFVADCIQRESSSVVVVGVIDLSPLLVYSISLFHVGVGVVVKVLALSNDPAVVRRARRERHACVHRSNWSETLLLGRSSR